MNLQACAQLPGVLVERRLEPGFAQPAALQPLRREALHFLAQASCIDVGRAEQLQRPGGAAAFGERGALEHHRAGIAARHRDARRVRAGIDPGALAERPAVSGAVLGRPAGHRNDFELDVETQRLPVPAREFAHRQAMAHRQRAGADEALPARAQPQALDRPAGRIGPIEHPDRLAMPRRGLQHVAQRGDEGVDAAAEVLQVDQQDVEGLHHGRRRSPHRAVEAEDRDAVHRVGKVRRLDHVVLLVAAQAVLRTERRRQFQIGKRGQRVERMHQLARHRGGMREQRDALAGERLA